MSFPSRPAALLALLLALGGAGCAQASQPTPAPAPPKTMAARNDAVLHSGVFRQAEAPVKGGFTIRRDGGRTLLVLSDDFSTNPQAPDLKVAIGRAANPIAGSKAPAYPLQEGSYTVIAPLKAASGGQVYELPTGLDLGAQGSVIIWCEQFNATMAWAPLAR
ncbi:DM13 domain-containing protein [Cyanobium sp. NIES-981]|uniref:DM13 domain-containing protein n=1 Tax=Cyanobium sp. NIES-981 TaxID=1851505 RepID=UPI0007DD3541|nr:DM13 domain-containing protein [Cyanobium sp. NIES-981]SBO44874.1 conserved exported protein of unknown function [Cyanobium sp. NIES-981]